MYFSRLTTAVFVVVVAFRAHAAGLSVSTQPASSQPATSQAFEQPGLVPVTVEVVDRDTLEPVRGFQCSWWFDSPQKTAFEERQGELTSQTPDGKFVLKVPVTCRLTVDVRRANYCVCRGSQSFGPEDQDRHWLVELDPGESVEGIVRNLKGEPIQGAQLMPVEFCAPGWCEDRKRAVSTDKDGRFSLGGLEPDQDIAVEHADYFPMWVDQNASDESENGADQNRGRSAHFEFRTTDNGDLRLEITMVSGEPVRGIVRDPQGRPIAGVEVAGGDKGTKTTADGRFTLKSIGGICDDDATKICCSLEFSAEHFINQQIADHKIGPDELAIVLQPMPVLEGRVVGDDGRPVPVFQVWAGPGREPRHYECSTVEGRDGRFRLEIDKNEPTWVAIKAEGYALYETHTYRPRAELEEARLQRGSSIRGELRLPAGHRGKVWLEVLPERAASSDDWNRDLSQRQESGTVRKQVIDGRFEISGLLSGGSTLYIFGENITPLTTFLDLTTAAPQDLGRLIVQGAGTVVGQMHDPEDGHVWAFADGALDFGGSRNSPIKPISFTTDAEGRFQLSGVPVGLAQVSFSYHESADILGTHSGYVRVLENQVSEVRFFHPSVERDVIFRVQVGDGSDEQLKTGAALASRYALEARRKQASTPPPAWPDSAPETSETLAEREVPLESEPPQVDVTLDSLSDGPISFSAGESTPLNSDVTVRDVCPGAYRVSVQHFFGRSTLAQKQVTIRPDMEPIVLTLGAGSIIGRFDFEEYVSIWAVRQGANPLIMSDWQNDGAFAARFLEPGEYVVYAHSDKGGWSRFGPLAVRDNMVDSGVHELRKGAELTGVVRFVPGKPPPGELVAVDANGIEIDGHEPKNGQRFSFPKLWPGRWEVLLRSGGEVIARGQAELGESGSVEVELRSAGPGTQPSAVFKSASLRDRG